MTILWTLSDLHQEHADNAFDLATHAPSSFDVLVVAGDVHTPGARAIDWIADRFPGVPTVYTLGNHDYWWDRSDDRYTYGDAIDRARDRASARGITLLADSTAEIGGIRFVGGTLWTDLRHGAFSRGHAWNEARRHMNDYTRIRRRPSGSHRHFRPAESVALHAATVGFLRDALATPFDGPTAIVTHHAPSPRSLPGGRSHLDWCYASDLDAFVESSGVDLWLHGHVHVHNDYRIGSTRVLSNPRGHVEEAATSGFIPDLTVDLSSGSRLRAVTVHQGLDEAA